MKRMHKHPLSDVAHEAEREAVRKAWRMLRREHGIVDAPDEIWIGPGWFGILDETIRGQVLEALRIHFAME